MTGPSIELFEAVALYQGLPLSDERIAAAVDAHAAIADGLMALRAVSLSYLEPTEPSTAIGWIERGGGVL